MLVAAIGKANFMFAWMSRTGLPSQLSRAAPSLTGQLRLGESSGLSHSLDRLFGALSGTLDTLSARRDALTKIKSELAALRSSLQTAGRQGLSSGPRALSAIIKDLELTIDRAVYGTVDVLETRPVYEIRDIIATREIYETRPVYEQRDIRATIVSGTRDLSGFSRVSNAGIDNGADFSLQVGSGPLAVVKFSSSTRITLTVSGASTTFSFASNGGEWRTGLLNALNSIANLSAQYTSDGRLQLQTSDAQSLTVADVANGALDLSGSPLASLGLTAGTTQSTVIGTEQVQVGTEEVVVGQEQYVAGQEEVQVGTEQVKVGTEQVQTGTVAYSAGTRSLTVGFDRSASAGGAARVDDIQARIEALALAVNAVASSSEAGPAPAIANGARALAEQLTALIDSPDFAALASGADNDAFNRVMTALDTAFSGAEMLDAKFGDEASRITAAGQAELASLLLHSGRQGAPDDPVGLARLTGAMLSGFSTSIISGHRMSFWA